MSTLFDAVRNGQTELKTASELANIAGKALKAEQLQLAREVFALGRVSRPNGAAPYFLNDEPTKDKPAS